MKSYEKPTSDQVEAAIPLLSSPQHEAYFFAQLENPHWIAPLQARGMFDHPPEREQVKGGGIRFPIWPASQYLARMATLAPDEVASIFVRLETDNVSIIGDMVHAALAMPATVATTLVPLVSRAAREGVLWIHFKDACDLCVRLADDGELSVALTLAEALFAPRFEEGEERPGRRDEYWYEAGLKKVVPALVGREPHEFLSRLSDWLKLSVDAKKHVDRNSGSDYSYLWRPAIEEHGQNLRHDFAGVMVGFVRAGFEKAIRDGALALDDALGILAGYRYLIFARLRIHLINEFADQKPELARRTMLDRQLFDDLQYKHEYARLVGQRLDLFTVEERDTWFAWVDAGPDMADFDDSFRERQGRQPTEEDRQNRREYWQFKKLHCVRTHLGGKRRVFYQAMLAKHGEPELADFNTYVSAGAWGAISPMTVADLAALTFHQAVDKVSSWQPGERQFMGPDTEGLAGTFGEYVASNPEVFSRQAEALIERPAIYVRAFITQMAEAVKAGGEVDAFAVLRLCRWVLARPVEERTSPEPEGGALVDRGWQWTRDEISRFGQNVCEAKAGDVPRYPLEGLREEIWPIVDALCRDPAQSNIVHDVSKDDPRMQDYLTLGINSPRGKAVEAGLEYARWVANHIKRTEGERDVIPAGFEAMPEVREMLEWQIATDNRTLEALAVIGSRIGLIYWIDRAWLAANAARLFYLRGIGESPPSVHGWAAWNAFLVWVRPHIEFYRLFKDQFAYAVEQSTQVTVAEQSREGPMNHLGEHLMLLYARGQLGLDDDDGLLRRFLSDSHPDIRRYAIEFVGRVLQDDERLPADVVDRLMTLWDVYWTGQGKRDLQQKPDGWLFGMWFSSGQLPEQWALERLEDFVEATPTPEPDHAIAEQLAKIASVDIVRVARILDRMVRGDREGWRIQGWLDSARQVLEAAMKAGGDARTQAELTIDYLGRRGHTSFGELLGLGGVAD